MTNRWFVSIEMPKQWRGTRGFARQTKSFPTEAEARKYAKEKLADGNKILAGTLLSDHQLERRILSGSQVYRWIEENDPA